MSNTGLSRGNSVNYSMDFLCIFLYNRSRFVIYYCSYEFHAYIEVVSIHEMTGFATLVADKRKGASMTDERTRTLLGWLGKLVTVSLNEGEGRPGAASYPRSGYVTGAEGKTIPAYLLGVTQSASTYTGRVISAVRRFSEDEDKLIVAPAWVEMYEPWIRASVSERESIDNTRLFCLYEKSCGVIPYRVRDGRLEYLALYQSGSCTWSFPKGHMEYGEDEVATAHREVLEEIGVDMEITTDFRCEISYSVHNRRSRKTVILFAVYFDGEITLREGEISDAKWLPRTDVQKLFGHRELRGIFNRLEKKISEENQ